MKRFSFIWIIMIALLAGCAPSPYQISQMTEDEMSNLTDKQVFHALRNYPNNDLLCEEAIYRGIVGKKDLPYIRRKQLAIGMSEEAMLAVMGRPDRVNRSVTRYGERRQYVFERDSYRTRYVYVEEGEVVSWQD